MRGGTVVGGTDETLQSLPVDFASGVVGTGELNKYDTTVAGILAHMGIDPAVYLPGVAPFTAPTAT